MKFTVNWLKEFVELNLSPADLAKTLTMAGLEVESVAAVREPESGQEDWLLEVGVTPNRGDCLGIAGIAREVAALTGGKLKTPPLNAAAKVSTIKNEFPSRLKMRCSARVTRRE